MGQAAAAASPITDLSALPIVLTLREMAALYRVSQLTIRRNLAVNKFRPLPFKKYPYRWHRDDVLRELESRDSKLPMRRHGFAAKKRARLEAELAGVSE